ncbi:Spy/CpxP family protein refolding chaperone [Janthinobacterium sp. RB2R34]|uniref:Spy/CpxP family protein refolding chaperone n=1 Tax=Janthinobacterium sp. RB2R34 TaxID=3424193 RepID=UPI003F26DFDD
MKQATAMMSLLLATALGAPLAAHAQHGLDHGPGPGLRMEGPGAGLPPFLRGVQLSEAQQDKVFAATYAQAPLLREQQKIAFKAHEQLRELASSNHYDDAKAVALANGAAQAMAKISLQHARLEQQLLAVLTPEQRQQAEARTAQHGEQASRP